MVLPNLQAADKAVYEYYVHLINQYIAKLHDKKTLSGSQILHL